MSRIIGWFSQGAASATAIKIAIDENNRRENPSEFLVVNIFIKDEFDDGGYFNAQCEELFGQPIIQITNDKYKSSVDTVIQKTRYMSGVYGARCTKELKKQVRFDFQQFDDVHVFGMTAEEAHRVDQLLDTEPELDIWTPLIEQGMTKANCFEFIELYGLDLPMMYQLGYHNNNCIGCLKASGAGYWNKIRVDFPEVFNKRAEQERLLNVAMVEVSDRKIKAHPEYQIILDEEIRTGKPVLKTKGNGRVRIPLRFLPADMGNHKDLDIGACGFFCESKGGPAV